MKASLNHSLSGISSEKITLSKGASLFHQTQPVVNFFYVKIGKIKLIRDTIEGGQTLIYVALAGESLAEASLFSDTYHCSAIADAASEVVVYKKTELLAHLEHDVFAMKSMLKMFAQQVRDLRTINEIKNIHIAKERILAFMNYEMNEHQELYLDMSLKDMAYKIGLAHETFYRELKKLEQEGLLLRKDGYFKLL